MNRENRFEKVKYFCIWNFVLARIFCGYWTVRDRDEWVRGFLIDKLSLWWILGHDEDTVLVIKDAMVI